MEVSLKVALSKSVIIRMIDYCFTNGPKSLSDDGTWNGLLMVVQGHVSCLLNVYVINYMELLTILLILFIGN